VPVRVGQPELLLFLLFSMIIVTTMTLESLATFRVSARLTTPIGDGAVTTITATEPRQRKIVV
jgi:hypothetical protein